MLEDNISVHYFSSICQYVSNMKLDIYFLIILIMLAITFIAEGEDD